MRLIDVETLIKQVTKKSYTRSSIDLIKNQPTVKAIPVEWMLDYISIWISEPYKNFVLNMIKIWEKENETNRR